MPASAAVTYDSAFQHASFSGTRTALTGPQLLIAVMDAWSFAPSKIVVPPCTHSYSVPERSTPCSTTVAPLALTSLLPDTCNCGAAPEVVAATSVAVTTAEV